LDSTDITILPSGQLVLSPRDSPLAPALARGPGHLLLALAAQPEVATPSFAFFRDFARDFIAAACRGESTPVDLETRVSTAPPFAGAEYLSATLLAMYWNTLAAAFQEERGREPLETFVARFGGEWHVAGRVYFHLAEHKRDPDSPFAFLATYTSGDKHEPLGTALERYAGTKNQAALAALLAPVQRGAAASDWLKALVDSGDVFHPLAWSPEEAYAFLRELPALEASGIIMRIPDWWRLRRKPEVTITVGKKAPSDLGFDTLLDFDAELTLGGERLSEADLRAAGDGLVLLKGKWVEVDRARLEEVLTHWRGVAKEGLSFIDGMRLLAGAQVSGTDAFTPAILQPRVGPWLKKALESLERPRELDPGSAIAATLRPYQKQGLAWLSTLTQLELSALLADDMGLGKTLQVLSLIAMLARGGGPHLLIVPASLIGNWLSEIERFAPHLRVQIAHGAFAWSGEVASADIVLTTYGFVQRAEALRTHAWHLVVLDEAQAIKNPAAKQTRAVKALKSRARIALTGTPVENRLGDLWSLFDFLAPGLLGSAASFTRFEKKLADQHDYGPLRRLVRPYILRRMKTDKTVISDLPDKTEVNAYCALSKAQAALYQKSVDALARALQSADGLARRGLVLAFLLRFKQICNHPSQWLGDRAYAPEGSGKFTRLREIAEIIAERQDKLLVFSQFREMVRPLHDFLEGIFGRPGLVLAGDTPIAKRKTLVAEFQDPAGPPFFVLSLKAGGTGLNLTAASHVVHFDRWWNPAVEDQATDRAFRIGQKRNVLVHKFLCRGTVEEKIDTLIAGKRGLSHEILGGDKEIPLTELSNDALIALVTLDLDTIASSG
jgi:non-specific serine/threonine protein kinase